MNKIVLYCYILINIFCEITINNICYANDYEINYKLNNQEFIRKIPDSIIEKYKDSPQKITTNIANLFNDPINLIILYELVQKVVTILDENKIDYWLTEETLLNYNKFNNFAPWQHDVQLGIDYDKFRKYLNKITTSNEDIVFTCYDDILHLQDLPNVVFTKDSFIKVIKKYEPELTTETILEKHENISKNGHSLKLYFYPYAVSNVGVTHSINYLYYLFIKSNKKSKGHNFNDMYPLKTTYLNSLAVKIPNNINTVIKLESRQCGFYELCNNRTIYSNSRSFNLKYIKNFPEITPLLHEFLNFIFK